MPCKARSQIQRVTQPLFAVCALEAYTSRVQGLGQGKSAPEIMNGTIQKTKPRIERNRVLVTGGAGFVGSHLCTYLVERGDHVSSIFLTSKEV